ncbi:MAG: hypothetical protein ABI927_05720 [Gaiellaceae bacterium]
MKPLVCLCISCGLLGTGLAIADSTPIGKLPAGPRSTIVTPKGTFVAVALPGKQPADLVWRLARAVRPSVLREVSETDLDGNVVVVFRAVGRGHATIAFALTRGDTSSKALRAQTYVVTVR